MEQIRKVLLADNEVLKKGKEEIASEWQKIVDQKKAEEQKKETELARHNEREESLLEKSAVFSLSEKIRDSGLY